MDGKIVTAAKAVLKAHKADDCPGTAAAGVALAHMIVEQHESQPSSFTFKLDDDGTENKPGTKRAAEE